MDFWWFLPNGFRNKAVGRHSTKFIYAAAMEFRCVSIDTKREPLLDLTHNNLSTARLICMWMIMRSDVNVYLVCLAFVLHPRHSNCRMIHIFSVVKWINEYIDRGQEVAHAATQTKDLNQIRAKKYCRRVFHQVSIIYLPLRSLTILEAIRFQ